MIHDAYDFLKDDPNLGHLVRACNLQSLPKVILPFDTYLIKSIVSQQLSIKAAETIYSRFENLFPNNIPSIHHIIKVDIEKLRLAGLSYRKAEYTKNVANYFLKKDIKKLEEKSDAELIQELSLIKGVGKWTVQMLLIFKLRRQDVLPLGDLIVRKGIMSILEISEFNKMTEASIIKHSQVWRPYRSYVSRLMWAARAKDLLPF